MPFDNSTCGDNSPFVVLGEGSNAPALNYNLPQNTCYSGNGYIPISIDSSLFRRDLWPPTVSNPWERASKMDEVQIESTLRRDLTSGFKSKLLQNAHFLRFHSYLIRLLRDSPDHVIVNDTNPQGLPNDDPNMRRNRMGNAKEPSKRVNHLSLLANHPADRILVAGFTLEFLVESIQQGQIPQLYKTFGGKVRLRLLSQPAPQYRLTLVEHYKMCSYLGDYGAGKTVRTFSLLPGERTSITLKTYKDKTSSHSASSQVSSNEYASSYYADDETSTAMASENILDSFSQYSADQLQSQIETMEGVSNGEFTGDNSQFDAGAGGGAGGGFNLLGLLHGQMGGSFQAAIGTQNSTNSIREEYMATLNSALEATVSESGQYRDVEVNTTTANSSNSSVGGEEGSSSAFSSSQQTQWTSASGESATTIRHLHNINLSRTLNFVFRQMLQEHVVLTYLHDVSFIFSTGIPGQTTRLRLYQLLPFLQDAVTDPAEAQRVFSAVLRHLCNVADHNGALVPFAEKATENLTDCFGSGTPVTREYWRKKAGLKDMYTAGGLALEVPGIIVSTASHLLRTDSVIVDAVLGQGAALDCYNARMQEEAIREAELKNDALEEATRSDKKKVDLGVRTIEKLNDISERVVAFRKIFGDCCEEELKLPLTNNSN